MIDVVSIKFKNCGKNYFFSPNGTDPKPGDMLVVETAKGLELVECSRGIHAVEDSSVIQPLRPVIRKATEADLRSEENSKKREGEAFVICEQKIEEHGLDMKLVSVECSFDGSKTTFFFTSDGRVDFRELVKDLAAIFHNRIELRQIGVRDEAKMIGGIGICGRPYCCNQFLEDFAPVSTKMAKIQSLSLNPAKISGSCGRLMCCLRYEEDAYEELVKNVPKQGAFVQTEEGYGTAIQIDLLKQTVRVRLDGESEDSFKVFKASRVAAVPGGRPAEGQPLPDVLVLKPEEEEEEEILPAQDDKWIFPDYLPQAEEVPETEADEPAAAPDKAPKKSSHRRHRGGGSKSGKGPKPKQPAGNAEGKAAPEKQGNVSEKKESRPNGQKNSGKPKENNSKKSNDGKKPAAVQNKKPAASGESKKAPAENGGKASAANGGKSSSHSSGKFRRRYHHSGSKKPNTGNAGKEKQS